MLANRAQITPQFQQYVDYPYFYGNDLMLMDAPKKPQPYSSSRLPKKPRHMERPGQDTYSSARHGPSKVLTAV